MEEYAREPW